LLAGYATAYLYVGRRNDPGSFIVREYDVAWPVHLFKPAAVLEAKLFRKRVCLQRFLPTVPMDRTPEYPVYMAAP
jgi:hypothetical protein